MDVASIYRILWRLRDAPTPKLLKSEMASELFKGDNADRGRLHVLTWLLFRKSLSKHSTRTLKDLPKTTMARAGSAVVLERHSQTLAGDGSLNASAKQLLKDAVGRTRSSEWLREHFESAPTSLGEFFSVSQWSIAAYGIMDEAHDSWMQEVIHRRHVAPAENAIAGLLGDQPALERLGESVVRRFVRELLRAALAISLGEERSQSGSQLNQLGESVADLLIREGAFSDNGPIRRGLPAEGLQNLSSDALAGAAAELLAEELCEEYWRDERPTMLPGVAHRMTEMLAEEAEAKEVSWADASDHDIEQLCQGWASRRDLASELGLRFRPLASDAMSFLCRHSAGSRSVHRKLWEKWVRWFSRRSNFHRLIPWHTLSSTEFDRILYCLFSEVLGEEDEWRAVFKRSV